MERATLMCFCGEVHRSIDRHTSIITATAVFAATLRCHFHARHYLNQMVTVTSTGNKSMIVTSTSKHVERYRVVTVFLQ